MGELTCSCNARFCVNGPSGTTRPQMYTIYMTHITSAYKMCTNGHWKVIKVSVEEPNNVSFVYPWGYGITRTGSAGLAQIGSVGLSQSLPGTLSGGTGQLSQLGQLQKDAGITIGSSGSSWWRNWFK